jgi:hypothetical protein
MLQVAAPATDASAPSPTHERPGGAMRKMHQEARKIMAHKWRCRDLKRPDAGEMAKLVAEFHARGGQVKLVAPAHAASIQNGAGRDADRWTI